MTACDSWPAGGIFPGARFDGQLGDSLLAKQVIHDFSNRVLRVGREPRGRIDHAEGCASGSERAQLVSYVIDINVEILFAAAPYWKMGHDLSSGAGLFASAAVYYRQSQRSDRMEAGLATVRVVGFVNVTGRCS